MTSCTLPSYPGIPIVISFLPFDAYFYRIGQSAPKLDVSPCASKDDVAIDTPTLRSAKGRSLIIAPPVTFESGVIARSKPTTVSRTKSVSFVYGRELVGT